MAFDRADAGGGTASQFEKAASPYSTLADFQREVDRYPVGVIDCDVDAAGAGALKAKLKNAPVFMLGEAHGVEQTPNVIYTLFKKFGFRHLALEWACDMNGWADRFVKGDSAVIDLADIHDTCGGGMTPGHIAVLQQLKKEGLLEKLTLFHPTGRFGDGDDDTRDRLMAENFLSRLSAAPALVCTGSLHAVTRENLEYDFATKFPMGYHVRQAVPEVQEGRINYLSGQFFCLHGDDRTLGAGDFPDLSGQSPQGRPRFFFNEEKGTFSFELPRALPARSLMFYPGIEQRMRGEAGPGPAAPPAPG